MEGTGCLRVFSLSERTQLFIGEYSVSGVVLPASVPRCLVSFVLCEWVFFLSFICYLLICYFIYMRDKQPCEKTEIAGVILAEITE